jgi:acyl dehydratase
MSDWTVGETREVTVVDDLKRTQIVQYAGASGDYNPLHTDEPFATQVAGYPSVFAHGMLIMGFLGQLVSDWAGPARVRKLSCRFKAITWPGDVITCRGQVVSLDGDVAQLALSATSQKGAIVAEGSAIVAFPSAP